MKPRSIALAFLISAASSMVFVGCAQHRTSTTQSTSLSASRPASQPIDPITAKIRDEGLNHSQVMTTLDYLANVIGERLTGSPACKHASEWTRDTLSKWGLDNAHLEAWGPFGRGWELERFSAQVVKPYTIVLHGYPRAWSPGFDQPLTAEIVYVDAQRMRELDKFRGKLKGKIVLLGQPRDVDARFEPMANRLTDDELNKLAMADPNTDSLLGSQPRSQSPGERRAQFAAAGPAGERLFNRRGATQPTTQSTSQPTSRPVGGRRGPTTQAFFAPRALQFAADEGAALVITASIQGDGGTIFVQQAAIPGDSPFGGGANARNARPTTSASNPSTSPTTSPDDEMPTTFPALPPPGLTAATRPRVWTNDAPKIPPQLTLAVEDYNRLVHMIKLGQSLTAVVDLQVEFFGDDPMSYNTVAEIPGSDLKDQIVMVGAHLDSWHSGTGTTDNGVGSAAAMEAIRILKALDLHPRRTIRVALWTGEEEGIFGSTAYVKQHFGYVQEPATMPTSMPATMTTTAPATRPIIKLGDYENLSVYFNLDNGTGKIRGIYAQANYGAVPLFKKWLEPFADLGAKTVTLANTGSTDHIPFDRVGLPGFQFIQDPIEYSSRTHHSNEDVFDRAQADDLKQANTIMASFLWNAANMNDRFPRKAPTTAPGR